jgi:hypothetical protein
VVLPDKTPLGVLASSAYEQHWERLCATISRNQQCRVSSCVFTSSAIGKSHLHIQSKGVIPQKVLTKREFLVKWLQQTQRRNDREIKYL